MSRLPDPVLNDTHSTAALEDDLACVSCEYNLRGLTADDRCPECGEPVGRSVRGDPLAEADPAWLVSVGLGLRLGVIAGWLWFVTVAVYSAVARRSLESLWPGLTRLPLPHFEQIMLWLGGATLTVLIVGGYTLWLVMKSDLTRRQSRPRVQTRRYALALGWLCMVSFVIVNVTALENDLWTTTAQLMWLMLVIVTCAAGWYVASHLAHLASRVPDPSLASAWRGMRWLWLATMALIYFEAAQPLVWWPGAGLSASTWVPIWATTVALQWSGRVMMLIVTARGCVLGMRTHKAVHATRRRRCAALD